MFWFLFIYLCFLVIHFWLQIKQYNNPPIWIGQRRTVHASNEQTVAQLDFEPLNKTQNEQSKSRILVAAVGAPGDGGSGWKTSLTAAEAEAADAEELDSGMNCIESGQTLLELETQHIQQQRSEHTTTRALPSAFFSPRAKRLPRISNALLQLPSPFPPKENWIAVASIRWAHRTRRISEKCVALGSSRWNKSPRIPSANCVKPTYASTHLCTQP